MRFTQVDLSSMGPPALVREIRFEQIKAEIISDFVRRYPAYTAFVESDPIIKLAEAAAYRVMLLMQQINDTGRAVLLATARGADLDHLAAFHGVQRMEEDGLVEPDDRLRLRVQYAIEAWSSCGPRGAYLYYTYTTSLKVKHADAVRLQPGVVGVAVVSTDNGGRASESLLNAVRTALSQEDRLPLTDSVIVQPATILPYDVRATFTYYPGPDAALVRATAEEAVRAYAAYTEKVGHDVTRARLYAALAQAGVQNVTLASPAADIPVRFGEVAVLRDVQFTDAGRDE